MSNKNLIILGYFIVSTLIITCTQSTDQDGYYPDDEWRESAPEEQGVDGEKLNEAFDYLISSVKGTEGDKHAIVIKNGYCIYSGDSIHNKEDTRNNPVLLTLAAGILLEQEKMQLDDLAVKYEKRLDCQYPEYGQIKIKHFLEKTAGYDAIGGRFHSEKIDGSLTPFVPGPPLSTPGDSLSCLHDAGNMFGLVLTKVAGEPLDGIIKENIMRPIGISDDKWEWWDHGMVDGIKVNKEGENGFLISASDYARVGYLLLRNGNWKGQQLISSDYIKMATTPRTGFDLGLGGKHRDVRGHLGYYFVTNAGYDNGPLLMKNVSESTYYHRNWYNNIIVVIPEHDMIIVRIGNCDLDERGLWDEGVAQFLQLVEAAVN